MAQLVKKPPAMWETWVQSLGWEDLLERGKATHSSILAWRIPWTVHGAAKSQTRLSDFHFHSLVVQRMGGHLPMQETQIQSLSRRIPHAAEPLKPTGRSY